MDIEGMVLAYYCCMVMTLLLQLQQQQQIQFTRFCLVKLTYENNFSFSQAYFLHRIPRVIFTYYLDI